MGQTFPSTQKGLSIETKRTTENESAVYVKESAMDKEEIYPLLGVALMCDDFVTDTVMEYLTFAEIHKLVRINKSMKERYDVNIKLFHLHSNKKWWDSTPKKKKKMLLSVDGDYDGSAKKWVTLPPGLNASNKLYVTWKDQGWGNVKGKLHVVKEGVSVTHDYQQAAEGVISTIGNAPRTFKEEVMDFELPHGCDSSGYKLWYNAGEGHILFIDKIRIVSKTLIRKSNL